MIGPYYRPQLTSVLSITHRATGVLLSLFGTPLLVWWLAAIDGGPEAYRTFAAALSGIAGRVSTAVLLFCLWFHFFNGIRHLVWDTGRMLDLPGAYRSGWAVLILTVLSTAGMLGALA